MDDLITLTCPSCGGHLQVGNITSVLKCNHCGVEHLVRRNGDAVTLEAYARCPKCGRNDRVQKVSAILRTQKQEVDSTEERTDTYYDELGHQHIRTIEVPVTHTQISGLAKMLIPPVNSETIPRPDSLPRPSSLPKPYCLPKPKPEPKPKFPKPRSFKRVLKILLLIAGPISIFSSCILSIVSIINLVNEPSIINFVIIAALLILQVIGLAILVLGIKIEPGDEKTIENWRREKEISLDSWQIDNEKIIEKWQEENNQIQKNWNSENEQLIKNWKQSNEQKYKSWQQQNADIKKSYKLAMKNWENLYFCHRDDCVFVPGDGSFAPIGELENYLFKDFPKPPYYKKVRPNTKVRNTPLSQKQTIIKKDVKLQDVDRRISQNKPVNTQAHPVQHITAQVINRCPYCGSHKISKPRRANMSCIWWIFIFFSMGLAVIFWFFTPKYVTCYNCGAKWKV